MTTLDKSLDRVLAGRLASLSFLLLLGGVVLWLLFATVHKQTPAKVLEQSPPRYQQVIMFWHDRGYFRHGGLWIRSPEHPLEWAPPKAGEDVKWAYSSSMGYLQLAHVLERLHILIRGRYSVMLMSIHNQAVIWLSSALLGWLAMRLALRMQVMPLHALLLGLSVQLVFQTFPPNLSNFWEINASAVVQIFAVLFLLTCEFQSGAVSTRLLALRGFAVFAMFYIDPSTATSFLIVYLGVRAVLGYPVVKDQRIAESLLFPAVLAVGIWMAQLLWVTLRFPGLQFLGSTMMFRTGLDGSVEYVRDQVDLFRLTRFRFNSGLRWLSLFVAGTLSLGLPIALHHRVPELRYPVLILATALGLYLPYAFVFSQGVSIHPHMFDTYLAIPLVLSLFCVAPATLEKLTGNKGVFVLVFVLTAACYVMVQLRTYAIDFPR